jgi:hypothetical protein
MSVLLPVLLLVWAIIAFFSEGSYWGRSRENIRQRNEETVKPATGGSNTQGYYIIPGTEKQVKLG